MLEAHPEKQERKQQGNVQDGPDTACQPENHGLQQRICEKDEDGSNQLGPGNPPASDDVPQQKTDKSIVEYGIGVGVVPHVLFHQQKRHPGKKNEKKQS